ncbi:MAG: hypothetical protein Q9199_005124 [Rusavskia elegans]
MAFEFDADEMQYILFLKTFYTDITCDALSKTFKHWYRRDVSPLAIELFHRKVKTEEPDGSFKDSVLVWAWLGFQSPASGTQIQALASTILRSNAILNADDNALSSRALYEQDRRKAVSNLTRTGEPMLRVDLEDPWNLSPVDLMEIYRQREKRHNALQEEMQRELLVCHCRAEYELNQTRQRERQVPPSQH